MTLGEFIKQLKSQPQDNLVCFGFCELTPCGLGRSMRDMYTLALSWDISEMITVSELISLCESAIWQVFISYHKEELAGSGEVELLVDKPGQYTGTAIDCVVNEGLYSLIKTKRIV